MGRTCRAQERRQNVSPRFKITARKSWQVIVEARAPKFHPEKERNMKTQVKRLAVSTAAAGALTFGMVQLGAPEAMAAPCGLSYTTGDVPGGPLKIVYYKIRNCHNY